MENTKKVYILADVEYDTEILLVTTSYEHACMRLLDEARQRHGNELYTVHDYIDVSEYKDLNEQEFYNALLKKYGNDTVKEMIYEEEYWYIFKEELVED